MLEIREPGEYTSDTPPDNSPTQPEPYTVPDENEQLELDLDDA
jgi:hypothetical protein